MSADLEQRTASHWPATLGECLLHEQAWGTAASSQASLTLPGALAADDAVLRLLEADASSVVVDGGVVGLDALKQVICPSAWALLSRLVAAASPADLAACAREIPALLCDMLDAGYGAAQVSRVSTLAADACTRRLLGLAQQALGEAPQPWVWLAFGSQARREQALLSDQDNGLLLADDADEEMLRWADAIAQRVCDGLDQCGYAWCRGGIMAKGRWRMPMAAWLALFRRWLLEPDPKALMHCSIFFDQRQVAGCERLHGEFLREISALAPSAAFLHMLVAEVSGHTLGSGLFGMLRSEGHGAQRRLNLKSRALLPLVDLLRVHALGAGVTAAGSLTRLQALAERGIVSKPDAANLQAAHHLLSALRLRAQRAQYRQHGELDHYLPLADLNAVDMAALRAALACISRARKVLEQRFLV